jgi:hypothetical protein
MYPIALDPTMARALTEYRQAELRASYPRKLRRRVVDAVRRPATPGATAVPRLPEVQVPAPRQQTGSQTDAPTAA